MGFDSDYLIQLIGGYYLTVSYTFCGGRQSTDAMVWSRMISLRVGAPVTSGDGKREIESKVISAEY